MIRRPFALLAALGLVLGPGGVQAQLVQSVTTIPLASDYDLDSTSYVYPHSTGALQRTWGPGNVGHGKIETSGSSTTVTGVVGADDPFANLAVGDELEIVYQGFTYFRYVAAKASSDSITVNTAIDLTNDAAFRWRDRTNGTAATSGWVPVHGMQSVLYQIDIDQLNVTGGIDVKVECRIIGATTSAVLINDPVDNETAVTSTGYSIHLQVAQFDECRMGIKIGTADDVDDLTTNTEKISIKVTGVR